VASLSNKKSLSPLDFLSALSGHSPSEALAMDRRASDASNHTGIVASCRRTLIAWFGI